MVKEVRPEWNINSIIGFILSFFPVLCFGGLYFCILALKQIDKVEKRGKILAIIGLVIACFVSMETILMTIALLSSLIQANSIASA